MESVGKWAASQENKMGLRSKTLQGAGSKKGQRRNDIWGATGV